jgi:hypothetical protein
VSVADGSPTDSRKHLGDSSMDYLYEALEKPTRLYIKQCSHCELKYFGKHSGKNIENYSGGGKRWNNHLKKHHAKAMHLWNSDWYYDTSISRFALKFSHINKIVESTKWANLKPENGLDGGWDYINSNGLSGNSKLSYLMNNDLEFSSKFKTNVSSGLKRYYELNGHHWEGRFHIDETKLKISEKSSVHQRGRGNSQYGTMWITNGNENKKIKKDVDIIPDGWYKGRKIL